MSIIQENIEEGMDDGESRERLIKEVERLTAQMNQLEDQKRSLEGQIEGMSLERRGMIGKLFTKGLEEAKAASMERDELFRRAKMYYGVEHDLDRALAEAEKIKDEDERNRCLAHLAISVLRVEGDSVKADDIVGKMTEDKFGYREYYEKEKKRRQNQ